MGRLWALYGVQFRLIFANGGTYLHGFLGTAIGRFYGRFFGGSHERTLLPWVASHVRAKEPDPFNLVPVAEDLRVGVENFFGGSDFFHGGSWQSVSERGMPSAGDAGIPDWIRSRKIPRSLSDPEHSRECREYIPCPVVPGKTGFSLLFLFSGGQ